jgi:hypothetical protein
LRYLGVISATGQDDALAKAIKERRRTVAQIITITALAAMAISASASAFAQGNVSVERGLYVSITGGCHDCHTEGYRDSGGKIDPDKAMRPLDGVAR